MRGTPKQKVLARFPAARVLTKNDHATVYHGTPVTDMVAMDVFPDKLIQGPTAAWRSAWFWCVRNPEKPADNG